MDLEVEVAEAEAMEGQALGLHRNNH